MFCSYVPVNRMEDKESELKKEYNKVHERYTEVGIPLFSYVCYGKSLFCHKCYNPNEGVFNSYERPNTQLQMSLKESPKHYLSIS